jgi:hemerythrin
MSKHQAVSPHPNPLPLAGEGANESLRDKKPVFDDARHTLGMDGMDNTHREFIAQVAALIAADNTEFPVLFQALVNHTREHFTAEGQLMRASKYRGLPEHESEHHRVLGELLQLNRSLKRGHLPLVRAYVKEGLMEWFDTHLAMMDAALAMHLKKQPVAV